MNKFQQFQEAKEAQLQSPKIRQERSFNSMAEKFANNVGIIRADWCSPSGKLQTICYGTAFAISKRVILTCAHTIFLQHKSRACTSVLFIPKHTSGYLKTNHKIYRSAENHFLQYQPIGKDQTYLKYPKAQDIALIYLSEDLEIQHYPQVGVKNERIVKFGSEASIAGFPSQSFYSCKNYYDIFFQRSTLSGRILEIKDHTVYHNLNTRTGHSGSAIMASTWDGKIVLIGVHTHKGQNRNSGVYLNKQILKKLIDYELYFQLKHSQYKVSIKFPQEQTKQLAEGLRLKQKLVQKDKKQLILQQKQKQMSNVEQSPRQLLTIEKGRDPTDIKFSTDHFDYYYNQDEFQQNCLPDGLINLYFDNIKALAASPTKWFHPLLITHIELGNKLLDSLQQIQQTRLHNEENLCQISEKISKLNGQMNTSINKLLQQIKKDGVNIRISKFPNVDHHLSILKRLELQWNEKQSADYELVPVCNFLKIFNIEQHKEDEQVQTKDWE